ncbi:MAG: hypothetical protein D6683_16895 [Actinomyces sp.]|nr:MAG: hypothetical protein D6683_16895 [Actinomyces sp.]
MASHPFLSPDWIAEARAIRDEFAGRVPPPEIDLRANVIVTGVPFGEGTVHGHLDTTTGFTIDTGHLADADVTLELSYGTARAIFVERDVQATMQALFTGAIKVTGPGSSKLVALAPVLADPAAADDEVASVAGEIARRIDAITS